MKVKMFIDLVYSMIDEQEFNQADVQPLKNRRDRWTAIGEAFEDTIKIMNIVEGDEDGNV